MSEIARIQLSPEPEQMLAFPHPGGIRSNQQNWPNYDLGAGGRRFKSSRPDQYLQQLAVRRLSLKGLSIQMSTSHCNHSLRSRLQPTLGAFVVCARLHEPRHIGVASPFTARL